jgi:adenine-specific DNA-methyltransferase
MDKPTKTELFSGASVERLDLGHPYYTSHLITYLGNKRRLLPFLYKNFLEIRQAVGKNKLVVLDGFAGSGAVSRLLKAFAGDLYVSDIERYSCTINEAYLANRSSIDAGKLEETIGWLNDNSYTDCGAGAGFIESNYAPEDDGDIKPGERVFYTRANARIIDNIRRLVDQVSPELRKLCLAALLVKASVHTNTSGVFKGFHKKLGNGHFGGRGENALSRIKGEIKLEVPMFSAFECPVHVINADVNQLVKDENLPWFDLAYFDPPYNQHPYGSNYFMLNIINDGVPVEIQPGVSGITRGWKRSSYNQKKAAGQALDELLSSTRASYIAISYNNEGLIPVEEFIRLISRHGEWKVAEQEYNTYRGSRNLGGRSIKVKELLWLIRKA